MQGSFCILKYAAPVFLLHMNLIAFNMGHSWKAKDMLLFFLT